MWSRNATVDKFDRECLKAIDVKRSPTVPNGTNASIVALINKISKEGMKYLFLLKTLLKTKRIYG